MLDAAGRGPARHLQRAQAVSYAICREPSASGICPGMFVLIQDPIGASEVG
jgi:hypothetical protein